MKDPWFKMYLSKWLAMKEVDNETLGIIMRAAFEYAFEDGPEKPLIEGFSKIEIGFVQDLCRSIGRTMDAAKSNSENAKKRWDNAKVCETENRICETENRTATETDAYARDIKNKEFKVEESKESKVGNIFGKHKAVFILNSDLEIVKREFPEDYNNVLQQLDDYYYNNPDSARFKSNDILKEISKAKAAMPERYTSRNGRPKPIDI